MADWLYIQECDWPWVDDFQRLNYGQLRKAKTPQFIAPFQFPALTFVKTNGEGMVESATDHVGEEPDELPWQISHEHGHD